MRHRPAPHRPRIDRVAARLMAAIAIGALLLIAVLAAETWPECPPDLDPPGVVRP